MSESSTPFDEVFADVLFAEGDVPSPSTAKLDPTEVFLSVDEGSVGAHVDASGLEERFEGDTSALPPDVCWTLQALVAAPHVSEQDRKYWPVLLQYEEVLRSRLAELGLMLDINSEHRYAFTRQADDQSPHSRSILRAKTLSLSASALALYLYQQYSTAPDDPIVEESDIFEHMMAYKPADDTDEGKFNEKTRRAIKALDDASIIKPIRGTGRYVIYGVIASILTADRVEDLKRRYHAIVCGDKADSADDTEEGVRSDDPS
jgi:hypothetical protein